MDIYYFCAVLTIRIDGVFLKGLELSILVGDLAAREHSDCLSRRRCTVYAVSIDDLASLELEPLLENLHGADIASEGDGDAPGRGHDMALLPRERVLL